MGGQEQVLPHAPAPPSSLAHVVPTDRAPGKGGLSGTVRPGGGQENQLLPTQAAEARSGAALGVPSPPPVVPVVESGPRSTAVAMWHDPILDWFCWAVGHRELCLELCLPQGSPAPVQGCFSGLMNPGGHGAGLCIQPMGRWTMLSAQGRTGWQCAAHSAYNKPASKLVKLPTTSKQSLREGLEQGSSNLLCSGRWKVLGQVKPDVRQDVGTSLWLRVHRLGARAGGMRESQKKCLPFTCCCTSILNRKRWLLCRAWVGSGLQLWQQEAEPSSPRPDWRAWRCLLVTAHL